MNELHPKIRCKKKKRNLGKVEDGCEEVVAAILCWEEKLVLVMVMGSLWTDMVVVVVESLSRMLCCETMILIFVG